MFQRHRFDPANLIPPTRYGTQPRPCFCACIEKLRFSFCGVGMLPHGIRLHQYGRAPVAVRDDHLNRIVGDVQHAAISNNHEFKSHVCARHNLLIDACRKIGVAHNLRDLPFAAVPTDRPAATTETGSVMYPVVIPAEVKSPTVTPIGPP